MPILEGITYKELPGSGAFSYQDGKAHGIRNFHVEWSRRFDFLVVMVGGTLRTSTGEEVVYTEPQSFPGRSALKAVNVKIKGFGNISDDSDDPSYPYAEIDVDYEPRSEPPAHEGEGEEARVMATEELSFGGEFFLLAEGSLYWGETASQDQPAMVQIPTMIPTIDHTYVRKAVDPLPKATISAYLGKVNSVAYNGVAENLLLFAGATARREITAAGARPYEVTYVLRQRPAEYPWNKFYCPAQKGFIKVSRVLNAEIVPPLTVDDYGPFPRATFEGLLGN